jgi:hypothetical protein
MLSNEDELENNLHTRWHMEWLCGKPFSKRRLRLALRVAEELESEKPYDGKYHSLNFWQYERSQKAADPNQPGKIACALELACRRILPQSHFEPQAILALNHELHADYLGRPIFADPMNRICDFSAFLGSYPRL